MTERSSGHARFLASAAPGLLAAAALLMLLLSGSQLWLSYRDQIRTAQISTYNLASIFEARLDMALRRVDGDLRVLAAEIPHAAMHAWAMPQYRQRINETLRRRVLHRDELVGFRFVDVNGDALYLSGVGKNQRFNVADRLYFQRLRDDPEAGLAISGVLRGRGVERDIVVVGRRLQDAAGEFHGAVLAVLDLTYFRRQFESLDLGKHGMITLFHDDALVLGIPGSDTHADADAVVPAPPPSAAAVAGGAAPHDEASPELVPRILSVVRMANYPFNITVGLGRDEVLRVWYQQVAVVMISALSLIMLVTELLTRLRWAHVRQQRMLDELAASETQFRELTQFVPVGIAYFDRAGCCTYVNDRCAEIAGRNCAALTGEDWTAFVHPDDWPGLPSAHAGEEMLPALASRELRFIQPDGRIVCVLSALQSGLRLGGGRLRGYLVALTDITQRKQMETDLMAARQRAETADHGKTRFLATASHDLRQPIQAINLFLDALGRTDLNQEQREIAGYLSRAGRAVGDLLYSLLDLSKLDAGQVKPQPRVIELETLFGGIDAEFSTLARQKNLRFKLFFPFGQHVLFTDPALVMSVIRNLVDNALKYTERGGILVGARQRQGKLVLQVWDTGVGIDPCYGERVFEERFRIDDTAWDRSKGLGLGLNIARRMTEILGGTLSYRSRPGRGSVFELVLAESDPLLLAATWLRDVPPAAVAAAPLFAGKTVVVVEDDVLVASAVELAFVDLGAHPRVFGSAEAALATPGLADADFFVSDYNLPGSDGLTLLRAVEQQRGKPVCAVLMTGGADRPELSEVFSPWPVLFKPVDMACLSAALARQVGSTEVAA